MKLIKYIFCAILLIGVASADTINIDWMDGNTTYAQTTCEVGGDIILPSPPTKRGYTFKGWLTGYTRLEYIKSTGTQYIDTGIYYKAGLTISLDFTPPNTQYQCLFGFGPVASARPFTLWKYDNNNITLFHHSISDVLSTDTGRQILTFSSTENYSPAKTLVLFGAQTTSSIIYGNMTCYRCLIKDGSLVRNFIPAKRNSDSVIGMYDTVSGQFFTNAGSGEFIAGPVAKNQSFDE